MCCRNTHSTRSHAGYSSKLVGLSVNVSLLLLLRSCAWEKSWHQFIRCGMPSMSSLERMCMVSNSPTTAAGAHIPPGPILNTAATQLAVVTQMSLQDVRYTGIHSTRPPAKHSCNPNFRFLICLTSSLNHSLRGSQG